ncbi:MAG: pyridoxal phosphate-dependent aminotransferase [Bacteroidetes bacterium]|nr:pyridoxal phosphate-dependent aminotransferase [Bacteroidota bacterium]
MDKPAKRIEVLEESQTIAMAKASRQLKAQGVDVINLSFGEPDFKTPEHIRDAAKKFLDGGYVYYTPVCGIPELRKAISEKFKRENNLDFAPEQIVVSTGAKHSLMNLMLVLVEVGDEVIIPTPYWVSYSEMVKMAEGQCVFVKGAEENNFKITPKQLESSITDKSRVFLFSSPCNPTGSFYSKEELKGLAEVLVKYPNIYIVADEIYEHINFSGQHESMAQFEELKGRVVVVNGVSKAFAMTGWRLGYIGAPAWIATACDKLQSQFTSGTNAIAQHAAIAALNSPMQSTKEMCEVFRGRRDVVYERIKKIKGFETRLPDGAFYFFPNVAHYFGKKSTERTITNGEELCNYLLHEAHVAIVPGSAFGAEGFVRISYAASEADLLKALDRIEVALNKLD